MSNNTPAIKHPSLVDRVLHTVCAARDGSVEIRRRLDLSEHALRRRGLTRQEVVQSVFRSRLLPVSEAQANWKLDETS